MPCLRAVRTLLMRETFYRFTESVMKVILSSILWRRPHNTVVPPTFSLVFFGIAFVMGDKSFSKDFSFLSILSSVENTSLSRIVLTSSIIILLLSNIPTLPYCALVRNLYYVILGDNDHTADNTRRLSRSDERIC